MDDERIERALRAGPPDELPHRRGALARGLAARARAEEAGSTFRVRLRPQDSPSALVFLAAAVALIAIGIGLAILGSSNRPTASPTPSGSPPPSPTTLASPSTAQGAPVQLVDRWVGPTKAIPDLSSPSTRTILDIQGAFFRVDAGSGQPADMFASSVSQAGADSLRLTASSPTRGCTAFDVGTYRWSLSPGGTTLHLSLVEDMCKARSAVLPGDWEHTACREAGRDCLGPVEAGTYRSTDLDLFRSGHAGQLTYTVPGGWANAIDHRVNYAIRPASDYLADPAADGNDTVSGVYVWAGALAVEQPADCSAVPDTGVATSADAIASHVAQLEGLAVVDQGSITIDGRPARVLDIALDPAYRVPCPWSNGEPFRSLFMFADLGADGGVQGVAPGERARIILVDMAPGRVTAIWIDGEATRFDTLVREGMPIIESFRFQDLGPLP